MTDTPLQSPQTALREALVAAQGRRIQKYAECPIERPRCVSKPPETCPRCFAKRNDICFAKHDADQRFIAEVGQALAEWPAIEREAVLEAAKVCADLATDIGIRRDALVRKGRTAKRRLDAMSEAIAALGKAERMILALPARSEPAHNDPDDITYAGSEPVVDGDAEVRRLALEDAAKVARAQAEWERELATKPGVGRKAAANHNGAAVACEQVEAAIQALAGLAPGHFMSAWEPDHVGRVDTGKGESDRG